MEPDIAIGFCSGSTLTAEFVRSLTACYARWPRLPLRTIHVISGPDLAHARNLIVENYLQFTVSDRLLMVDTDIVFTPGDVEALVAHTEDVVCGVYMQSDGLLVVDGAGFMLARRSVYERLGAGCFDNVDGLGEDKSFLSRTEFVTDESIRVGHVKSVVL